MKDEKQTKVEKKEEVSKYEIEDRVGKLDIVLQKILSRKLLVFLTSLIFFSIGRLNGDQYILICVAYIGSEGIADIVSRVKKAKK